MALSPIEDSYLQRLTSSQFPDMPASEPAMPVDAAALDAPSMDGMQLAAGPSQTVSDAGPSIGPIPRNTFQAAVGKLGELIQSGAEKIDFDVIGLPGVGSMTLKDLTVGDLGKVLQDMSYGFMPVRGGNVATGGIGTFGLKADPVMELLNAAPAVVSVAKGAVKAAKATKGMPVGMSTQAVGGMDGVLTQTAKATAPVNDMGFYSAVEQAALNIQRKSGTGQAMLNDITKGQDVKLDEVKWIGLDDFLKGKKNVTREEVQQFIAANKVDVQEVTLGGDFKPITDPQEAINYLAKEKGLTPEQLVDEYGYIDPNDYVDLANDVVQPAKAKFGAYTLPGGENYREILLTTPTNMSAYNDYVKTLRAKYGEGGFSNLPLTEAERARLDKFYANEDVQPYKSSHWEQPNVLAHIRVNDRVDVDGKKMLLVEEVQSDWHQAGRDKGYKGNPSQEAIDAGLKQAKAMGYSDEQIAEMNPQTIASFTSAGSQAVPDAPMKDTWYQLALKRVLKYAADNGYERVGLTTGKTNAERFNLAETFDAMNYKKNKDGTFSLAVKPKGEGIFQSDFGGTTLSNISEKDLPSIVGKELSQKIVAGEGRQAASRKVLEGIDLQVGGEGMKKYYDEIYPQFLAKYGKKWSAKVGETQIKIGADKVEPGISAPGIGVEFPAKTTPVPMEKVRFVDITPEMRQGVGKGQPLFTATGIGAGTTGATMQDKEQK